MTVHEFSEKKLILLLHLPYGEDWKMFVNTKINIEDDIISSSIERFENKCNLEAVPALTTDEWFERCSFPIGLDDEHNFIDLE